MNLFLNGQIIKEEQLTLSSENRALNYGDGLFETMKFAEGKICYLNDHLNRLQAGAEAFHMRVPKAFTEDYIQNTVSLLAEKNKLSDARVKILLWRKAGGLFSPDSQDSEYLILVKKWQESPHQKYKVAFSTERKNYSGLSRYKLLSSALYIMAGIEKSRIKADDVIILNHNKEIVECLNSNVFWEKSSEIFTPAIETGCIDGIMRKQIITQLKNLGVSIREGHFSKEELLKADSAFTSNIGGLSAINNIENSVFSKDSEIFDKLRQQFK
jgi:4-amino-4-deoxychorismate lyase